MSSHEVNEKITPLPWCVEKSDGLLDSKAKFETGSRVLIYSADCDIHPIADCSCNHTCRMEDEQEANAAYIVQACNAYPDLVAENERLRELVREILDDYYAPPPDRSLNWHEWADRARTALSTEPARRG